MRKYTNILILIAFFFFVENMNSQVNIPMECATDECSMTNGIFKAPNISTNSSRDKYYDYYNTDLSMWIPQSTNNVKWIKINFIIVQRYANDPQDFSSNGVRSDGTRDEDYLKLLVSRLNELYANLEDPSDNAAVSICGLCNQVKNTKIQFSLEGIHYYVDNNAWGNPNTTYSYNKESEINIYLPNYVSGVSWCSGYSDNNLNQNIYLMLNNFYNIYLAGESYTPFTTLAHELGHAIGLCHTYLGGGCYNSFQDLVNRGGYFDDHFGPYPGRCPEKVITWNYNPYQNNNDSISNNIMSSTVYRGYWSPKQIGAINRNLAFNNCRKYLKNSVHNLNKIVINSDEIWDFDMFLDRDIQIDNLGSIILSKNLQMPEYSTITINSGGEFTINNSIIQNPIEKMWNGIIVKSGGLLTLNTTNISDYNIIVESGATLIIKGALGIIGDHNITIQNGGYICFESGSNVHLTDYNSVIRIYEGSIYGVNPMLNLSTNCAAIPIPTGNGSITDFNQDIYIQNETISSNRYIGGKNIYVGNHVTTTQTSGDVLITNGANVIFDCKTITFDAGYETALGSTIEVKNH
ncbi:MAG: hypothetical protein LLF95_03930 [Bacteroidales bacterium]|nr:hypothetical protein [Bacteroidales bacterium]